MNDSTFKTGQNFPQGKFANYQTTLSTSNEGTTSVVSRRVSHNFCCDEMVGAIERRLIALNEESTLLIREECFPDGCGHFDTLKSTAVIVFCPFCGTRLKTAK